MPRIPRLRFELLNQMGVGTREMSERVAFRRVCVLWMGGGAGGGARAVSSTVFGVFGHVMLVYDSCGVWYLFSSIYDVLGAPNMLHRPSL